MEDFLNLFFKIDTDYDEVIHLKDLSAYVAKNHLDTCMITRWRTLFGAESTGIIKLAKFCEVLGLRQEDALVRRQSAIHMESNKFSLGSDVEELAADMQQVMKVKVTNETRRLLRSKGTNASPAEYAQGLKVYLDREFGRAWHVIVVRGSFWMNFSHVRERSFQFRLKNWHFLVWQTPVDE
ncbi:Tegument antigen [Fasciolopsis buskii]|uniref:Tegument antigen n=1 Tax=Fasciolopsis buskii TaxID=27845 RepID=A0A8E0S5A4_9TREM|nr:Tegument antigen [Fasciolopsis buski]